MNPAMRRCVLSGFGVLGCRLPFPLSWSFIDLNTYSHSRHKDHYGDDIQCHKPLPTSCLIVGIKAIDIGHYRQRTISKTHSYKCQDDLRNADILMFMGIYN